MSIRDQLGREPKPVPDRNHPHEFKRLSDNWVGHGVAPVGSGGESDTWFQIAGAAMQFTGRQCAICRRTPEDPIHFPVQD